MRIQKRTIAIAATCSLVIALVVIVAVGVHVGSQWAKTYLIVQYYRALSADDQEALEEMTAKGFTDQLGIVDLKRRSYSLYDLGESIDGVLRYIIVLDGANGNKRAILAEMTYSKRGSPRKIESIRLVDQGKRLKE
jgi:hypothetical protein